MSVVGCFEHIRGDNTSKWNQGMQRELAITYLHVIMIEGKWLFLKIVQKELQPSLNVEVEVRQRRHLALLTF